MVNGASDSNFNMSTWPAISRAAQKKLSNSNQTSLQSWAQSWERSSTRALAANYLPRLFASSPAFQKLKSAAIDTIKDRNWRTINLKKLLLEYKKLEAVTETIEKYQGTHAHEAVKKSPLRHSIELDYLKEQESELAEAFVQELSLFVHYLDTEESEKIKNNYEKQFMIFQEAASFYEQNMPQIKEEQADIADKYEKHYLTDNEIEQAKIVLPHKKFISDSSSAKISALQVLDNCEAMSLLIQNASKEEFCEAYKDFYLEAFKYRSFVYFDRTSKLDLNLVTDAASELYDGYQAGHLELHQSSTEAYNKVFEFSQASKALQRITDTFENENELKLALKKLGEAYPNFDKLSISDLFEGWHRVKFDEEQEERISEAKKLAMSCLESSAKQRGFRGFSNETLHIMLLYLLNDYALGLLEANSNQPDQPMQKGSWAVTGSHISRVEEDYTSLFMKGSEDAKNKAIGKILQNPDISFAELRSFVADKRAAVAASMKDSIAKYEHVNPPSFNNLRGVGPAGTPFSFDTPRSHKPLQAETNVSGRLAYAPFKLMELMERNRFFEFDYNGNFISSIGLIGHEAISLTHLRLYESSVHIKGDITKATHSINSQSTKWFHPALYQEKFDLIEKKLESLFRQSLDPNISKENVLEIVARMHWWMAQEMRFDRGSAATADYITKAIFELRAIEYGRWKPYISPDIEAFNRSEEEYVKVYPRMFRYLKAA